MFEDFEVVSSYTRQQAIDDGYLVDISDLPIRKEAGIKIPTAITRNLWDKAIETNEKEKSLGQSIDGRLWDVLWMMKIAMKLNQQPTDQLSYKVSVQKENETHVEYDIIAHVGPGDNAEPVMTLMCPEDV